MVVHLSSTSTSVPSTDRRAGSGAPAPISKISNDRGVSEGALADKDPRFQKEQRGQEVYAPHEVQKAEAFAGALREQPKLRQALVARYGTDIGEQAVAAAMAWAWEHQDRLVGVTAMRAYLFRVGQSSTRRSWVWTSRNSASFPPEVADPEATNVDDALDLADLLRKLPQKQRSCVLLIYAHGWPYRDVAELLEISVDAVNNHTHRGIATLRKLTKNAAVEDNS